MHRFDATLVVEGGGAHVRLPAAVVEALGGTGRIPVHATFDGVPYQGSVVSMGGQRLIGVTKAIREQIAKGDGDVLTVRLEVDASERTVTVPGDFGAALEAAGLSAAFDALSYSHRRQHVLAIEEAKRADTRARRIESALAMLRG